MYSRYKKIGNPVSVAEKLVGRGLQLSPMRVAGKHITNTGVDRVTQSLFCLFSTRKGERLFQPEYGTRIYEYLHEQNDFILCDMIKEAAEEDIKQWETRINAKVRVSVVGNTNRVKMEVIYSIKGDSTKYTLAFPFYRGASTFGGDDIEF